MSFQTLKYRISIEKEKLNITNMALQDKYFHILYSYKPYGSESYTLNSNDGNGNFSQTVVNTYISDRTKLGSWLKLLKTYDSTPVTTINISTDPINVVLKKILTIRGYKDTTVNLSSFVEMYKIYRDYLKNCKISDGTKLLENSKLGFWGSDRSLKFGRVVFDLLNKSVDDIFGALLSPSGGLIGPNSTELLTLKNDSAITMHSIVHDASGYLINGFGLGNGYTYLDPNPLFKAEKTSPIAGQVTGIAKWISIVNSTTKLTNPFINNPKVPLDFKTVKNELKILSNYIYSENNLPLSQFTNYVNFSVNNNFLRCFIGFTKAVETRNGEICYNLYITFDCVATVMDENTYDGFNELIEGDAANTYINKDYFYIYKNIRSVFISNFINLLVKNTINEQKSISNIKHIFVGGHKLGGVIASLCTFDIPYFLPEIYQEEINNVTSTFTKLHLCLFDTPRVGDAEYVDKLYANINNLWRFNYVSDTTNQVGNSSYYHPQEIYVNITNTSGGYNQGSGDNRPSTSSFTAIGNFFTNKDIDTYRAAFKTRNISSFNVYRDFFNKVV